MKPNDVGRDDDGVAIVLGRGGEGADTGVRLVCDYGYAVCESHIGIFTSR